MAAEQEDWRLSRAPFRIEKDRDAGVSRTTITHAHIAVHGYLQHVNDEEEGDEADTARGIMSGIIDGSLGRICTNSVFAHIA